MMVIDENPFSKLTALKFLHLQNAFCVCFKMRLHQHKVKTMKDNDLLFRYYYQAADR